MSSKNSCKTLSGTIQIIAYLNCSRPTFYKFLKMGLPARLYQNKWFAHKDNIDEFFRRFTYVDNRNMDLPENVE